MDYTFFKKRRERFFEHIDDGIAVLHSGRVLTGANGYEYPFDPDSDFYYLTGFREPESVLVLSKNNGKCTSVLFVKPKDFNAERWTGRRLGPEKAVSELLVDEAYSLDDFDKKIEELLKGHRRLYTALFSDEPTFKKVLGMCSGYMKIRGPETSVPQEVVNSRFILGQLRLQKESDEIAAIKHALCTTSKIYHEVMKECAPGKNEADVYRMLESGFRMDGCGGAAYTSIVAGGPHATVMHYLENDKELKDGDLLLIDAAAKYNGWASDITRTFPVNGKFSDIQKKVYEIVLKSQKAGIEASCPGTTLDEIDRICKRILTEGLLELGVLSGNIEEHIEKKSASKYCPYSVSHWLGLNVHDTCTWVDKDCELRKLAPGMVFTVEPGLYFEEDDTDIPEELRGIGIRIEDDILITEDGYENLSAEIVKEIDDIERICSGK